MKTTPRTGRLAKRLDALPRETAWGFAIGTITAAALCPHKNYSRGAKQNTTSFWLGEQQNGAYAEPFRNSLDIVDRHVALAALDTAEIGSVHFDLERKILLAQAERPPVAADVRRQNAPEQTRMRTLHAA